jgi:hypothetical protein
MRTPANPKPFENLREMKRFAVILIECNCATLRYVMNHPVLITPAGVVLIHKLFTPQFRMTNDEC